MKISLLYLVLLLLPIAARAQPIHAPRFEDLAQEFVYDRTTPLNIRELSRQKKGSATLVDFTYDSIKGGSVPAYLIIPAGRGPFPVVIFGHWMMSGSPMANRNQFLEEALVLGKAGVLSLMIDAPMIRPGFVKENDRSRRAEQQSEASRQQVIDFRRAVDLLSARSDVDTRRLAYVGHSFNAHIGAILCAVDKRIQSFVLMAGGYADEEFVFDPNNPEMVQIRRQVGDAEIRDYFRKYAWDDPVHFLARSSPSAVFLQFGKQDKPLTVQMAQRAYERFGDPKRIAFYDAGHALNAAARRDRVRWLTRRLSFRGVDMEALASIPDLK